MSWSWYKCLGHIAASDVIEVTYAVVFLSVMQAYRQDCETFATVTKMLIKSVIFLSYFIVLFHNGDLCFVF